MSEVGEYTITRDGDRYGSLGSDFPDVLTVVGTREQALRLANYLSNYYVGCDLLFRVEGTTEGEYYAEDVQI
jgi:hypothetical protein